jgi:hypothetical protein
MDDTQLDQMIAEAERATALAALEALISLCDRTEAELALSGLLAIEGASGTHCKTYGHRLSYGCCLRAHEASLPSCVDDAG